MILLTKRSHALLNIIPRPPRTWACLDTTRKTFSTEGGARTKEERLRNLQVESRILERLVREEKWPKILKLSLKSANMPPSAHQLAAAIGAHDLETKADVALFAISKMKERGVDFPYDNVIKAYSNSGMTAQVMSLLAEMRAAGLKPSVHTYLRMMRGFEEKGDWYEVLALFESMKADGIQPAQEAYAYILSVSSSEPEDVMHFFTEMVESNLIPDKRAYTLLINACGPDRTLAYFSKMREAGLRPTVYAWKSIVDAYLDAGEGTESTQKVIDEMKKHGVRDEVCERLRREHEDERLTSRTQQRNINVDGSYATRKAHIAEVELIKPREFLSDYNDVVETSTFNTPRIPSIVSNSIGIDVSNKIHSSVLEGTAMHAPDTRQSSSIVSNKGIDVKQKAKSVDDSIGMHTHEETAAALEPAEDSRKENRSMKREVAGVPESGLTNLQRRLQHTRNRVERLAADGNWGEILELSLKSTRGFTVVQFAQALRMHNLKTRADITMYALTKMRESGTCIPYDSVIQACSKADMHAYVKSLFWDMQVAGYTPSLDTYVCMLQALAHEKEWQDAPIVLEHMKEDNIRPTLDVYRYIVKCYCEDNLQLEKVDYVFSEMRKNNVTPNRTFYKILIDACLEHKRPDLAITYFGRMRSAGVQPKGGTWNLILEAYIDVGKCMESIEEVVAEMTNRKVTVTEKHTQRILRLKQEGQLSSTKGSVCSIDENRIDAPVDVKHTSSEHVEETVSEKHTQRILGLKQEEQLRHSIDNVCSAHEHTCSKHLEPLFTDVRELHVPSQHPDNVCSIDRIEAPAAVESREHTCCEHSLKTIHAPKMPALSTGLHESSRVVSRKGVSEPSENILSSSSDILIPSIAEVRAPICSKHVLKTADVREPPILTQHIDTTSPIEVSDPPTRIISRQKDIRIPTHTLVNRVGPHPCKHEANVRLQEYKRTIGDVKMSEFADILSKKGKLLVEFELSTPRRVLDMLVRLNKKKHNQHTIYIDGSNREEVLFCSQFLKISATDFEKKDNFICEDSKDMYTYSSPDAVEQSVDTVKLHEYLLSVHLILLYAHILFQA